METAVPASSHDTARLSAAGRAPAWNDDDAWGDQSAPVHALSASEATQLRVTLGDQRLAPSPWRIVQWQAMAGIVFALVASLLAGWAGAGSALYGAATAVIPGAILARAVTRMASNRSPVATAASLLGWESVKLVCTAAMLAAAHSILHPVVWLALLGALMGCLCVYWAALAWRPRTQKRLPGRRIDGS
jgi:ATP synthase protein I